MNKIGTTNKLQELAPLLWLYSQEYNPDNKFLYQEDIQSIKQKNALLGEAATYMGLNQLHDAHFIDIKESGRDIVITLKDWWVLDLAWSLVEYKQLPIIYSKYPYSFELIFKNVSHFSYNIVDDKGEISKIEKVELKDYLYDQILILEPNKIEICINAWSFDKNIKSRENRNVYLLLVAENIEVNESQEQDWHSVFGNEYDDLFGYFKEERRKGRWIQGMNVCIDVIKEYENSQK